MKTTVFQIRGAACERLPRRVARFEVLSMLGIGGMGTVLYGVDPDTLQSAAIKVIRPDSPVWHLDFLEDEAEVLARFRHPGIVGYIESSFATRCAYLAMEYVCGETLESASFAGPLPFVQIARVLPPFLGTLSDLHQAGHLHRDLKPANVIVANDGRVVLVDFGLAGRIGERNEGLGGFVLGTPRYMAPEQYWLDAPEDGRSDLFSFGCVLYECLTGLPPFGGGDADEVLRRVDDGPPQPPSTLRNGVPRELDDLALSLLARDMSGRPTSAAEARCALEEGLAACVDAHRRATPARLRMCGTTCLAS